MCNFVYYFNQLGQDWDDMVSEVTSGGCGTIDRRLSQRQEVFIITNKEYALYLN